MGVVGCGRISHSHAKAAAPIPEKVRFVSCCDIREDGARAWAERYGCDSYYTDYTEMIRGEQLDAVLLATWPNQHREQIERCLDAGVRSILCEKALALTGTHALEIEKMVQAHRAFLMEGLMYRHHPAIAFMDEVLASGQLGPVDSIRADFSAFDAESDEPDDDNRNWRQRKECGGGVPYDFACYCVNACNHVADGLPKRVYCHGDISDRYGTINRMHGLIEYDGAVGVIESSKKADHSERLEIVGAHGRLVVPISWTIRNDIDIVVQRSTGWARYDRSSHVIANTNTKQRQLENFAAVIRCGAHPVVPLWESVIGAITMEALVDSLERRESVAVRIPSDLRALHQESKQ